MTAKSDTNGGNKMRVSGAQGTNFPINTPSLTREQDALVIARVALAMIGNVGRYYEATIARKALEEIEACLSRTQSTNGEVNNDTDVE